MRRRFRHHYHHRYKQKGGIAVPWGKVLQEGVESAIEAGRLVNKNPEKVYAYKPHQHTKKKWKKELHIFLDQQHQKLDSDLTKMGDPCFKKNKYYFIPEETSISTVPSTFINNVNKGKEIYNLSPPELNEINSIHFNTCPWARMSQMTRRRRYKCHPYKIWM